MRVKLIVIDVDDKSFFFQAEDGIRDLVRSRGLGDVYKRQFQHTLEAGTDQVGVLRHVGGQGVAVLQEAHVAQLLSLIHI